MSDIITVTGVVATPPRVSTVAGGLKITSFRLASGQRRFDKGRDRWVDGDTNWYTVTAFRQLAVNVGNSVLKGDRVVATGRVRIKDWTSEGRNGTTIDVEADAVGHDLAWGTTAFTRVRASAAAANQETAEAAPVEAGFSSITGEVWTTPLAPLGFDAHSAADAYGGAEAYGAPTPDTPYGVEGGDLDSDADTDFDDDGAERDDDGSPRQPSFSAAESAPF
jgi:single-strand DNA-binding protein